MEPLKGAFTLKYYTVTKTLAYYKLNILCPQKVLLNWVQVPSCLSMVLLLNSIVFLTSALLALTGTMSNNIEFMYI